MIGAQRRVGRRCCAHVMQVQMMSTNTAHVSADGPRRRSRRSAVSLLTVAAAGAMVVAFPAQPLPGSDAEAAWHEFRHALGEPADIGANADHPLANARWRPIPAINPADIDEAKFRLGFQLFHEGRLSSADSVACISCHAGPQGGVDGLRFSRGVNRALGHFNSLSVINASFHFRHFWDGRATTMHDQAFEPIINEVEMANTRDAVLAMLEADEQYRVRFDGVYPDGVTLNNLSDALVHFQRVNFTRADSAFLRHLAGAPDQLSDSALRGMQRFEDVGCATCHNGISVGGNSYQKLGARVPYYNDQRPPGVNDEGLYRHSGRIKDLHVFKVPGLHTVAATAPYFHDGSVATLASAIELMAQHQLDVILPEQDVDDIAAFLRSLLPEPAPLPVDMSRPATPSSDAAPRLTDTLAADPAYAIAHRNAYMAVIEEASEAYTKLTDAARRVLTGAVAHFDFVQFEHIELIRRARALQVPPAEYDAAAQQALIALANDLSDELAALEWVIADLLRAYAKGEIITVGRAGEGDSNMPGEHTDIGDKYHEYQSIIASAMARLEASATPQLIADMLRVISAPSVH